MEAILEKSSFILGVKGLIHAVALRYQEKEKKVKFEKTLSEFV